MSATRKSAPASSSSAAAPAPSRASSQCDCAPSSMPINNYHTKHKSRLQLMSSTGFTQKHEMTMFQRVWKLVRLPAFSEYFMSVDHHRIWRRHLAWSLRDGDHLRNAVTSRFASNMVFMSLLLGTEIGVLFSPSKPADAFRSALKDKSYGDCNFWAALILCVSIGLTLSTLVANFTAWAIIGAVSPHNSHTILRSSVGLDAAQLPARLVILSIYCFVVWVLFFIMIIVPYFWGFVIAIPTVALIWYIVVLYSSFGRLVIYSRAMFHKEIFRKEEDSHMSPSRLFEELLKIAEMEKEKQSPLPLYYRSKKELSEKLVEMRAQQDELEDMGFGSSHATRYVDRILSSSGHQDNPLPFLDDLLKSADEYENEDDHLQMNGIAQSPVDEEQPHEGADTISSLEASSPFSLGSTKRSSVGLNRGSATPTPQAAKRGHSDTDAVTRRKRQARRGCSLGRTTSPRDSGRTIFQSSAGGPATVTLTL